MLRTDNDETRVIMTRQRSCTVWIPLMGLLSLTLISLLACTRSSEPEWTPILQDDFTPGVSVTGILVPAAWATASSTVDGQVTEILVREGDLVAPGDVLLRLDDRDATAAVRQAEAALQQVRAELDMLEAGPRDEDLAVAAAQVEAARAALTQTMKQRDQL